MSEFATCRCGATVPNVDGPTHRYLDAVPACWAAFGELLALEFGNVAYWPAHRYTVDAYALQHPGVPAPPTINSAVVHLTSLYLIFERDFEPSDATRAMQAAAQRKDEWSWLEPPDSFGDVTASDVVGARSPEEHLERTIAWAHSTWESWEPHHTTIREWASRILA